MNVFVADPEWGWEIVAYFYLGGIAAGAYFAATLIDLVSGGRARPLTRLGYFLALPLVAICGLLLTIDLGRPERFWHMLFKSEVVKSGVIAPIFKPWSPMSAGSWCLSLFGLCAGLSVVGALWPHKRWTHWLNDGVPARLLQGLGCVAGLFLASYTGTLLSATNQPGWSDTTWLAPLFLASAASTGLAALLLLSAAWPVPHEERRRLERADLLIALLELAVFLGFLASLGTWLRPVWRTPHGKMLIVGTLTLAIVLPLALHLLTGFRRGAERRMAVAALLALMGGFVLRYAIVHLPADLLAAGPSVLAIAPDRPVATPPAAPGLLPDLSPEDGRAVGGGPGADPLNRPVTVRSRVFPTEEKSP